MLKKHRNSALDFIGNCFVTRRSRATKQFPTPRSYFRLSLFSRAIALSVLKFRFSCDRSSLGRQKSDRSQCNELVALYFKAVAMIADSPSITDLSKRCKKKGLTAIITTPATTPPNRSDQKNPATPPLNPLPDSVTDHEF